MSVQNGDVVLVNIGGVTVGALVSNGHNQLADMLDASNKDTPGVKQYQAGETGWTFTLESLYDPAATEGLSEALGYLKAGTQITVTHGISGTSVQSGSGYIASLECSGPKNEIGSYSLEIQGTGNVGVGYGPELHTDANAASDPNGNEADAVTGWTQTGLDAGSNVFESQNSVVNTGTYALHGECNDTPTSAARFELALTVEEGATYRATGYWRHVGTGSGWNLNINGVVEDSVAPEDTTFQKFDITFVAPDTSTYIRFIEGGGSNDGGVYVDNVSVKKVL
jgi:hypothetical protein